MDKTVLERLVLLINENNFENLTYSDYINPYFIQEIENLLDRYGYLPDELSDKLIDLKICFSEM